MIKNEENMKLKNYFNDYIKLSKKSVNGAKQKTTTQNPLKMCILPFLVMPPIERNMRY